MVQFLLCLLLSNREERGGLKLCEKYLTPDKLLSKQGLSLGVHFPEIRAYSVTDSFILIFI